jgi:Terpene synthase family 2, C-terminal metal binding
MLAGQQEAAMLPTISLDLHCPISPVISPYADEAEDWLASWVARNGLRREYAMGGFARYAARLYPDARLDDLCALSALFTWFFHADDEFDRGSVPEPERVRDTVAEVIRYLRTGAVRADIPLLRVLADAWHEPMDRMPAPWRARFVGAVEHHLQGVITEAREKAAGRRPRVAPYVELRRATSAAYVGHTLIDFGQRVAVPERFYRHATVRAFSAAGNDLLSWFNDMLTVERDIAISGGHNLVLALAGEHRLSIEAATEMARERWHRLMSRLPALRAAVPRHGPAGAAYLDGVEHAVRGTMDWSFDSARYS